mmetsp:Transcript_10934/g.27085  ORF Transcript_10934/g.27085 Transcript_10934/m.27085 type:complete len:271 (+) Transcript_10934:871-1683(+)
MGEGQIHTPSVDVNTVAQKSLRHRTTLNVPPRPALAQAGLPKHLSVILLVRLPQSKVSRSLLLNPLRFRISDSPTLSSSIFHVVKVKAGEVSVVWEALDIKVVGPFALIRVSLVYEPLNHVDHIINVVGCSRILACRDNIQHRQVAEESIGKLVGQVLERDIVTLHPLNDLIVHICQVAHVVHVKATVQQPALDQVVGEEGPEVANMCKIVHCGSAGVHAHLAILDGNKGLLVSGQGVVENNLLREAHAESGTCRPCQRRERPARQKTIV